MIKKKYYSLSSSDFKVYLEELKNSPNSIHIFQNTSTSYFLYMNQDIHTLFLQLHKKQLELDYLYQSLTPFQKELIIQTCMLDEIQSTNEIENIYSTKKNIFSIVNNVKGIQNKKIISMINSYTMLKELSLENIYTLSRIKELYELLMDHAYDSIHDKIDGKYFRKNDIHISNELKIVHTGFHPEEKIIEGMNEFLHYYNQADLDLYLRILITHFMFETIHPYYDGNGRYGRFLMSLKLNNENPSLFAYCIASSINQNKSKYYKALESARDLHEYGYMNDYILTLGTILLDGLTNTIHTIQERIKQYNTLQTTIANMPFTKSERIIYDCLMQATILTYFGISNEQIILTTKLSKRTVIYSMNKFRELKLLKEIKLGKVTYHQLNNIDSITDY